MLELKKTVAKVDFTAKVDHKGASSITAEHGSLAPGRECSTVYNCKKGTERQRDKAVVVVFSERVFSSRNEFIRAKCCCVHLSEDSAG